jgi:hypothetical protein
MSPTTPEISRKPFRLQAGRTSIMSGFFQRMAGKAQQCMQAMAEWMRASATTPMAPQAVTCTDVAFAPNRLYRRGLMDSKGDFYFRGR